MTSVQLCDWLAPPPPSQGSHTHIKGAALTSYTLQGALQSVTCGERVKHDDYQSLIRIRRELLHALRDFTIVYNQRMDDPFPPLAAAHRLDAAIVIGDAEVRLRSVFYKLPLCTEHKMLTLFYK